MTQSFVINDLHTLQTIAEKIAQQITPNSIIALEGEIGAGKTTFSQFFGAALGITTTINSPTFTLVKEYTEGRLPLYHMDVYRLDEASALDMDIEHYFYANGVCLIEWASHIENLLPAHTIYIHLQYENDFTTRRLTLQTTTLTI